MAHLAKFAGGIEGQKLYEHWSRATDENGEYITYAREHGGGHIDRTKTENNFTIGEIKTREWIKNRLENVYQKPGQNRPIESCDIIVTLPQTESSDIENVKKFMGAAYRSLAKQYGKNDNIIGCWVHMDEAQPHLHFAFLPISERKSKQKPEYTEKLSTRAYWPKKNSLQIMHRQLQIDIDEAMGRHVDGINNGITKQQGGNKTIVELKTETAERQKRMDELTTSPEEMKKLEGKLEKPIFGDEYYKLTPHQYKRLRTIAQNSMQEKNETELIKRENRRLTTENAKLNRWMNYYLNESDEKAEKKYKDQNRELKTWVDNLDDEKQELLQKNDELERQNRKNQSAYEFLQITNQMNEFERWKTQKKKRGKQEKIKMRGIPPHSNKSR